MTKIRVILLVLCTLAVATVPSASAEQGKTMTVGNSSYIEVQRRGTPDSMQHIILGLLAKFEKDHPELEVTSFNIEKQQVAHVTGSYTFGIWVRHKPRK